MMPIRVAGKGFVVAVHYLDHVVSKDGKTSLIDFSTITSGSNGAGVPDPWWDRHRPRLTRDHLIPYAARTV